MGRVGQRCAVVTMFLDIDEVVVDLMTPLSRVHGLTFDRQNWPNEYDLAKVFGKSQEEVWKPVRGSEFWSTLPKTPWADDLVALLRAEFPDRLCFLSHGMELDPWSFAGKVRWLQEHFPGVPYLLGADKSFVGRPGAFLVDDYEKNETKWQKAGGTAILFPAPWNRFRGHPDPVGLVERMIRERRREQDMI